MLQDERAAARATAAEMGFVKPPAFEDYKGKYQKFFVLERHDGVLEIRMHTDGGPAVYDMALHNAWIHLWRDIGNDPDNEVLIFSGTGDYWTAPLGDVFAEPGTMQEAFSSLPSDTFFEQCCQDTGRVLEAFLANIDIPTIACINGPGIHTDIALLCDITLCASHAELVDPHFLNHFVPGDGQALTFQELMGLKASSYYMYTGEPIPAETAKQLGLVNEVLNLDELIPRARQLARLMMARPRHIRRFTSSLIRRQWKRRFEADFGLHVSLEMLGIKLG